MYPSSKHKVSNLLQSASHFRAQEFRRGWGDVMVEKMLELDCEVGWILYWILDWISYRILDWILN